MSELRAAGGHVALLLLFGTAGCEDMPAVVEAGADLGRDLSVAAPVGPERLSETGLYASFASRVLAPGVIAYTPRYQLWSDGAEKQRYLRLPPGEQIDTSDMDNWVFPVGTKVWKEFSRGSQVIETRLLHKVRDGKDGWWEVAYAWNDAHTEAIATPLGQPNALGTTHDIPSQEDCGKCHGNVRDVLIGVSALQLSAADGNGALSQLAKAGWLSAPPGAEFQVPGQGVVKDALGYLHGNCGHCHNDQSFFAHESVLRLRLHAADVIPEQTPTYQTSIRVKMFHDFGGVPYGIVPGSPDMSQLYVRMGLRDDSQMPPVCTKIVDDVGHATIRNWINSLP